MIARLAHIGVRLRSVFLWLSALAVFLPLGLIVVLLSFVVPPRRTDGFTKAGCRLLVRLAGIRVRVEGVHHLTGLTGAVLVCNHVNLFDGFLLYGHLPLSFRGVELDDHFRWPVYGSIIRRLGMIPISRTRARQASRSLQSARKALEAGDSILILPEGGRTLDDHMKPFKRGPFVLALSAGADIVPLVMVGAQKINRKGSLLIRPGRVTLRIAAPIPHSSFAHLSAEELKTLVRDVMEELLHEPLM